jgi:two-component system CheB/CheR fusion protein
LAGILETGSRIQDYVIEHNFREIGRKRLLLNGGRIDAEDQTPPLILLAIEDITEKRRVEQQVLAVSERERRRMAQELHDGLGQHLTAISFVAQTIHHQLRHQDYTEAAKNAEQLVTQVSEATGLTREAINNALKHGNATRIAITYKHNPQTGRARLLISDDGSSGPKPACPGEMILRGMGLQIMRYRAEGIGGKLQVNQAPGGGTFAMVTFGED